LAVRCQHNSCWGFPGRTARTCTYGGEMSEKHRCPPGTPKPFLHAETGRSWPHVRMEVVHGVVVGNMEDGVEPDGWKLQIEGDTVLMVVAITHCPFCGKKLGS